MLTRCNNSNNNNNPYAVSGMLFSGVVYMLFNCIHQVPAHGHLLMTCNVVLSPTAVSSFDCLNHCYSVCIAMRQ